MPVTVVPERANASRSRPLVALAVVTMLLASILAPTPAQAAPGIGRTGVPIGTIQEIYVEDGSIFVSDQDAKDFRVRARIVASGIAVADRAVESTQEDGRLVLAKTTLSAQEFDRYASEASDMLGELSATPEGRAFLEHLSEVRIPGVPDNGFLHDVDGVPTESEITVLIMPAPATGDTAVTPVAEPSEEWADGVASVMAFDFDHALGMWNPRVQEGAHPAVMPRTIALAHELVHVLHNAAGARSVGEVLTPGYAVVRHADGFEPIRTGVPTDLEEVYTTGGFSDLYAAYKARNARWGRSGEVPNVYENPAMVQSSRYVRRLLYEASTESEQAGLMKVLRAREGAAAAAFTEDSAARVLGYSSPRSGFSLVPVVFVDKAADAADYRSTKFDAFDELKHQIWPAEKKPSVAWSELTPADYADPLRSSRWEPQPIIPERYAASGVPKAWTRPGLETPELADGASGAAGAAGESPSNCLACSRSEMRVLSEKEAQAWDAEIAAAKEKASLTAGTSERVVERAIQEAARTGAVESDELNRLASTRGREAQGAFDVAPIAGGTTPRMPGLRAVTDAFGARVLEGAGTHAAVTANAPLAVLSVVDAFRADSSDLQKATAVFGVASLVVGELAAPVLAMQALAQLLSPGTATSDVPMVLWSTIMMAAGLEFPPLAAATLPLQAAWQWFESEAEMNDGLTLDQRVAIAYQRPSQAMMQDMATSIGRTQGMATALAMKQVMFRSAYVQSRLDMDALAAGFVSATLPAWIERAKQDIRESTLEQLSDLESRGLAQTESLWAKAVAEVNTGETYVKFRDRWVHEVWDAKRGEAVKTRIMILCSLSPVSYVACALHQQNTPASSYVTPTDTSGMAIATSMPFDPAAFIGGVTRAKDGIFPAYREQIEPTLFRRNDTHDPSTPQYNTTSSGYKVPSVQFEDTLAFVGPAAVGSTPWRITSPVLSSTTTTTPTKVGPFAAITGTGSPGHHVSIRDARGRPVCVAEVNAVGMWRCDRSAVPAVIPSATSLHDSFWRMPVDDADRVPDGVFTLFSAETRNAPFTPVGQSISWVADIAPVPDPLTLHDFTNSGRAVTGMVRLESGAPVAGAAVRILAKDPAAATASGTGDPFSAATTTGRGGEFRVTADPGARQGAAQLVVTLPGKEPLVNEVILSAPPTATVAEEPDLTALAGNVLQITKVTATAVHGVTATRHRVAISVPGMPGRFADVAADRNTGEFVLRLDATIPVGAKVTITSAVPEDGSERTQRTFPFRPGSSSPLFATVDRGTVDGLVLHSAPRTSVTVVTSFGSQWQCTTDASGRCTVTGVQRPVTLTISGARGLTRSYSIDRSSSALTPQ